MKDQHSPTDAHAPTPAMLQAVAVQAARRAGSYAQQHRSRRTETLMVARHDVKLALDVECQAIAAETIAAVFPSHGLLGEEGSPIGSLDDWHWVVDPIDGTVNFSHGQTAWCCSVAARLGNRTLAGAVYAPARDLLFEASCDGPACCNGERIRVSAIDRLDRAIVHTGADKSAYAREAPFRFFNAIAGVVQRPRISGSAALDVCEVACGGADAYFEPGIYLWDIAAAGLILERAGGCHAVLVPYADYRMAFLAANSPDMQVALRRVLEPLLEPASEA